ncbi:MAG: ribosome recycling factor [Oscillospiraceae bacterium]|nr:ribosome recycling factor [Oscillospiraceae bacterium]
MEQKMDKAINALIEEFAGVRAGRATPTVLAKVMVDYYGTATPVAQLANVSVPDPRTLMIQPYDASITKEVERAIIAADLGLTPNNDGKIIRIAFPPLTEDRRKELAKTVKARAEEAKVSVRNSRRDGMDDIKKQALPEDEARDQENELQKLTDKKIKEIDEILAKKEKELLEV